MISFIIVDFYLFIKINWSIIPVSLILTAFFYNLLITAGKISHFWIVQKLSFSRLQMLFKINIVVRICLIYRFALYLYNSIIFVNIGSLGYILLVLIGDLRF
jgi:hypothetical protein